MVSEPLSRMLASLLRYAHEIYRSVQVDSFLLVSDTLERMKKRTVSHTQRSVIVVFARDLKLKIPLHAR